MQVRKPLSLSYTWATIPRLCMTAFTRMGTLGFWACFLVLFSAKSARAADGQVLLGVLEEVPGVYVGEPARFAVRVLFQQVAENWQPFPDECENVHCVSSITSKYPVSVRWTISYEGRPLGIVSAHTPSDFKFYAHIGLQDVDAGQSPPTIGEPSEDYSGFGGTPVHRPLLATAGPAQPTPARAGWKSGTAEPSDLKWVWSSFRRLVPLIDDCRLDVRGENIPSNGRTPHLTEIEIANKWVNRSHDTILQARIRPDVFKHCDGPLGYRSEIWFYREATGKVWPLPGQGNGVAIESAPKDQRLGLVMPLDFVDIDGEGQDVAIFLMAGYDVGGYALYFDGFHKVSYFTWIYH